jgi:ornithine carbamoyltransferase
VKDLLRIADLSRAGLDHLLDLADRIHDNPRRHAGLLEGETVIACLATPSTRARLSFGSATTHLGGTSQVVDADDLQHSRGETMEDTARTMSRYAKALVVRTCSHDGVRRFAEAATVPVVNAGTDLHHPCQALADLLTLRHRFGGLEGVRLAYLGAGNDIAHSLIEACALAGVDLVVATPPGYEPDPRIVAAAQRQAAQSGSVLRATHDPLAAAAGANAIYTSGWRSWDDSGDARTERAAALQPYRVDIGLMAEADPRAIFLHPLPAQRGEEVAAAVIDGSRSAVLDQAENRMHTAQALLVALLLGDLQGAA